MSSLDPTIDLGRGGPPAGPAPLDRLRRVNAACERFEAAWRRGDRPSIERWLGEVGPEDRPELVRELVALEIELRRGAGEEPTVADYSTRFPGEAASLEGLWGAESSGSVGPYRLHGLLGCGAMGVIYRARQPGANRMVALKLMRAGPHATAEEVRRFRAEAEAAANLDHPNILPIHEVGQHQGQPFFTMKLVEGGNLSERLGEFIGQPEATARLLAKVARAAHYAHGRGFLHRDLKPSNILLDSGGEPHLADFGLAKRVETAGAGPCPEPAAQGGTLSGAIVGTPSYMAPEQATGRASGLSPATDVYGLGAILYAMLTGRPPFLAATVMETIVQVTEREPVPPRRLRGDVPVDLQRICLKCLEKEAAARYVSAAALADDLERFLKKEPVEARHVGVLGRLRRWARREPELVYRLLGIGTAAILTQLNYAYVIARTDRIPALHYRIIGVELLWIAAIVLLHLASRLRPSRLAPAWVLLDVGALTTLLSLLEGIESVLVLAYPLLIAASGLWSSVGLVWLATVASMAGYLLLWWASTARAEMIKPHYGDVVLATLVVAGAVVAHQVRRVWALSRFYEHKT